MMLYELLDYVNDDTEIELYSGESHDMVAHAEGYFERRNDDFEKYEYCEVTDIFVSDGKLCIDVDDSDLEEYDEN